MDRSETYTLPQRAVALSAVEVLGRLASLFEERRRQLAEGAGLSVSQWHALEEVQLDHFMPSMFAAKSDHSPAYVSKVLRQLVDKGLIVARLSERDGRQRQYSVTPAGQLLLDEVREERERAIAEVWLKLAPEELEQFVAVGGELANRLQVLARNKADRKKKE